MEIVFYVASGNPLVDCGRFYFIEYPECVFTLASILMISYRINALLHNMYYDIKLHPSDNPPYKTIKSWWMYKDTQELMSRIII